MIDYIGISDEARRIKAYFDGLGRIMTPEEVCKLTKKNSGINIDIELVPMETSLGTDVYKANTLISRGSTLYSIIPGLRHTWTRSSTMKSATG